MFTMELIFQNIFPQELVSQNDYEWIFQKYISIFSASLAISLTFVEITCYIVLYMHINLHNNTIASTLLDPSIIRLRNQANSISLTGQVLGWLMEIWYIVLIGFILNVFNPTSLREVAPFFKTFEFFLVPLVQIYTSPSIRRYLSSKT